MSGALSTIGDFAKGVGEGAISGVTGMARGIGNLATGAYGLATSGDARQQAWNTAVGDAQAAGNFIGTAVTDPGAAAGEVGSAVSGPWGNLASAYQQAAAAGHPGEFVGNIVGQGAVMVGAAALPGAVLGSAGDLAALDDAGTIAAEAGGGATAAGDVGAVGSTEGSSAGYVFRGDARPPDVVFSEGFQPQAPGAPTSLSDYALNNTPSDFVGFSTSQPVAEGFATAGGLRDGWSYTALPSQPGVDVNATLGASSPFPGEQEMAFPGGISASEIRGATPVLANGEYGEASVLNPGFGLDPAAVDPPAADISTPIGDPAPSAVPSAVPGDVGTIGTSGLSAFGTDGINTGTTDPASVGTIGTGGLSAFGSTGLGVGDANSSGLGSGGVDGADGAAGSPDGGIGGGIGGGVGGSDGAGGADGGDGGGGGDD